MAIPERSVLLGDLMRAPHPGPRRRHGHHDPGRGTSPPTDFGGPQYEGCNEHLNLTRPDVIRDIHAAYLEAGADLISTNTFGCAPYVLAEYGLAERCHEITLAAARICPRRRRRAFDAGAAALRHRRHGARARGRSRSPANVTFDEVRDGYYRQARALIEGGVDALLLETCQDTLNVKAAAIGVRAAMTEAGRRRCPSWSAAPSSPWARCWPGRAWTRSTPRSSTSISSRSGSTAPPVPSS